MVPLKLVKTALDSTINLINKGDDPTTALEKVSRDLDLNTNYIQRTGEALNVALFYNHVKKAGDKALDFPIADIPKATANIFGEKDKVANYIPSIEEDFDFNAILTNPKIKKASAEIRKIKDDSNEFPTSLRGQYEKCANYLSRIDKELDAIKVEKIANEINIESQFNSLTRVFKKTAQARIPFHEFESQAVSEYGDRAIGYIDLIYKSADLKEERGSHDKKYISYIPCSELKLLDSLMKSAVDSHILKAELKDAEEFVSIMKSQFKLANHKLYKGYIPVDSENTGCDKLADKIAEELEKDAAPGGSKSIIDNILSSYANSARSASEKKTSIFKNTENDNHERVTMLQELIMTDPILAHQDPKKILSAYQQILRLAPQLAKEKEIVRSLLRQLTATQSLAPVEGNQLIEANTNLLKQHKLWHSGQEDDKKRKD